MFTDSRLVSLQAFLAALFVASCGPKAPAVTEVHLAETPPLPVASATAEPDEPPVAAAPRPRPPRGDDPPPPKPEPGPSPSDIDRAKELFKDGTAAYANADYQTACLKFQAAYDIVPNQAILFNLGSCEMRMSHTAKACAHFRKYITNGDPSDPRIQQVTAQVANRCP